MSVVKIGFQKIAKIFWCSDNRVPEWKKPRGEKRIRIRYLPCRGAGNKIFLCSDNRVPEWTKLGGEKRIRIRFSPSSFFPSGARLSLHSDLLGPSTTKISKSYLDFSPMILWLRVITKCRILWLRAITKHSYSIHIACCINNFVFYNSLFRRDASL